MGYRIDIVEHDIRFKKEEEVELLQALKTLAKDDSNKYSVEYKKVLEADNLIKAFKELEFIFVLDENGDYILEDWEGEKDWNIEEVFDAIAPYIEEDSYIEFEGEDEATIRYTFNGIHALMDKYGGVGENE